jgi:hypothetical protein
LEQKRNFRAVSVQPPKFTVGKYEEIIFVAYELRTADTRLGPRSSDSPVQGRFYESKAGL